MDNRLNLEQIRSEARFYCYGAATAINIQREQDQILQNQLDRTIEKSVNLRELFVGYLPLLIN